jgi:hypothetical protein
VVARACGAPSWPFLLANNTVLVIGIFGAANLWAQSGMKARDAAVLGTALLVYDFVATSLLPLVNDLMGRLASLPFAPQITGQIGRRPVARIRPGRFAAGGGVPPGDAKSHRPYRGAARTVPGPGVAESVSRRDRAEQACSGRHLRFAIDQRRLRPRDRHVPHRAHSVGWRLWSG